MDEEFVKQLVEVGLDEKAAKDKVKKLRDTVEEVMKSEKPETRDRIIAQKVREFCRIVKRSDVEKKEFICVAAGPMRDVLEGIKRAHLKAYEEDPQQAIQQGLVMINDKGEPIPIDDRKVFSSGDINKNYGKPIGTVMRRQVVLVVDGAVEVLNTDLDLEKGKAYQGYMGVLNGRPYVYKRLGVKEIKSLTEEEIWNATDEACASSPIAVELKDLAPSNNVVAIKGTIEEVIELSNGGQMVIVTDFEDEQAPEVPIFLEDGVEAEKGVEAIVFGRIFASTYEDGPGFAGQAFGVVVNPATRRFTQLDEQLTDVLFE